MADAEPNGADDPIVIDLLKRNLVSPFLPGTVVSSPSLVIDKYGCAWWVRPDPMVMIRVECKRDMRTSTDG
jgi:hypothetical protein